MENISKLTPILYAKNETNFNHNGLGKLTTLLIYEIDEVLNGEFEALFEYPANGRLADKMDNELFIKAKPNKKDEPHVFKIYDYELDTVAQTYLIYARSKNIEDLRNNMILDVNVRNQAPTQAWNLAKNNALDPVDTTFYSDITTTSSVHWERRNLLSTIAGQEGSMIQYWGGEIKHTIGRVSLFRRRGQDNVTTVRHGKNLEGLTATYSTKGLVTAIVPYYVKSEDKTVYGNVVKSEYVNHYSNTYYDVVEYNDEELGLKREDEPENGWADSTIESALNRVAKNWFKENIGKDLPSINMEIALEDISQTKEYEQFKDFEQIELGDTITVYSKKFNLNITAKVRRVVYNGLTDKNELVEVGTARRSLYDDVRDDFKKIETELQEGIDHAMISANGKNTNYSGTADPNEIGLVGQNNDNYFRTNGQLKELWIYRDGMWHLEVGDLTGEQIRAEVEQAQQEIAEAQQTADEAVEQIDTAVANAGFTSLDETISSVQTISNQAQINSSTAIDNALEAMNTASLAVENTGSLNVRVDEVEDTLSVKADKQLVDDLTGVVDLQAVDIKANADGLKLKANQDTVDLINGRVSSLGTEVDAVAGQISNRVWKTDIESAVDGIEVGGRNLLQFSGVKPYTSSGAHIDLNRGLIYGTTRWFLEFPPYTLGEEEYYTLSVGKVLNDNPIRTNMFTFRVNNVTKGTWRHQKDIYSNDTYTFSKSSIDGDSGDEVRFLFYLDWGTDVSSYEIHHLKIEKGNKATDWTPAPEDTLARFDHIETEWTQTFDTFSQTVAGIDGRVSKQEQTVSGMQSVVYDPETGLSSLNTQLADLVQVAVTGEEMTGAISVLEDNLNLRLVAKDEVITQINASTEGILLQADKVQALADVVVDGKLTITDEFIAPNAQIDGAKIADATIGSAKIASLDVGKLSGNVSNFIQSNWNDVSGNAVSINSSGINTYTAENERLNIRNGRIDFYNYYGSNTATIQNHYFSQFSETGLGISVTQAHPFVIHRPDSIGTIVYFGRTVTRFYQPVELDNTSLSNVGQLNMTGNIDLNANNIDSVGRLNLQGGGSIERVSSMRITAGSNDAIILNTYGNDKLEILQTVIRSHVPINLSHNQLNGVSRVSSISTQPLWLYAYGERRIEIGNTVIRFYRDLDMSGRPITNSPSISDASYKNIIGLRTEDDLNKLMQIDYTDFYWKSDGEQDFGFIAQQVQHAAPEILQELPDGKLGFSHHTYTHLIGHAVQILGHRYEGTAQLAESNEQKIHQLQQELSKANRRIEELERKIT